MGQSGVLLDLLVLAAVYAAWLLPKWRRLGKKPLLVYTLMYGCLAGIVRFTLMPVLTALPYCFDHPYIPMHMAPFEDVILRHGDYVRQIVLNVVLFLPFGVLQPLCDRCRGRRPRFGLRFEEDELRGGRRSGRFQTREGRKAGSHGD